MGCPSGFPEIRQRANNERHFRADAGAPRLKRSRGRGHSGIVTLARFIRCRRARTTCLSTVAALPAAGDRNVAWAHFRSRTRLSGHCRILTRQNKPGSRERIWKTKRGKAAKRKSGKAEFTNTASASCGRRAQGIQTFPPHDIAEQRPVQQIDLWLRRSGARNLGHAGRGADESRRPPSFRLARGLDDLA